MNWRNFGFEHVVAIAAASLSSYGLVRGNMWKHNPQNGRKYPQTSANQNHVAISTLQEARVSVFGGNEQFLDHWANIVGPSIFLWGQTIM